MTRVACIVNPNARDGKLGKNFRKIEEELAASGLDHDVFMTERTGHAIEIASDLRETDYDLVVAIGGDGTVHEVANGIRGSSKRLGIIPMGNGDDCARAIGIPLKDLQAAIQILSNGTDYTIGGIRAEAVSYTHLTLPTKA